MHTVFRGFLVSNDLPDSKLRVRCVGAFLLVAACLAAAPVLGQESGEEQALGAVSMTPDLWVEDLGIFSVELPQRHVGLFSQVRRSAYYEATGRLESTIATAIRDQIIFGLISIAAMADDENTLIWPFQPAIGYHILPVQAYWFDDGVYITGADEEYAYAVGSRVAGIGGHDIDEVFDTFKPVIGAENDYHKKILFFLYGFCPELLYNCGITDRPDFARFTLVNLKGETYAVDFSAVPFSSYAKRYFLTPVENKFSPAIFNRRVRNYWHRHLPELKTIYLQLNEIRDQPGGQTTDDFLSGLAALVDTTEFDRFVIDLRRRGGGDREKLAAIADFLADHEKINRHGRLFTIVGRSTSGAMLELASMLEYRTKTVFVGEPTGEGPNGVGESGTFTLPNSKIEVYYTKRFWPTSIPEDNRRWIAPDIRVKYYHQDFLDGRDPAMAAIFEYQPEERDHQPANRGDAQRIAGRYLFTPYQILEIRYADDLSESASPRLVMTLTDFIENSLFKVKSGLYAAGPIRFTTDIKGVDISVAFTGDESVEQLFVEWKGQNKTVQRAPDGYLLPMELIQHDRIEAGVTALLASPESRRYYRTTAGVFLRGKGYALLEKNRVDDAIRVFRALTELYPEESGSWASLADAFLAKGEKEVALRFYKKSLELDPDNAAATRRLEELE